MIKQKENMNHNFETIILVVVVFFFSVAFSDKPADKGLYPIPDSLEYALNTELHSYKDTAVPAEAVQLPSLLKSCIILYNTKFICTDERIKILTDNQKVARNIASLQKSRLAITPVPIFRYFFHCVPSGTEDLPVLG